MPRRPRRLNDPTSDSRSFATARLIADADTFFNLPPYVAAGGLYGQAGPLTVSSAYALITAWLVHVVGQVAQSVPEMPVISRDIAPSVSTDFGGVFAASRATDSNYGTFWNSVNVPTVGSPEWLVLDLRGVAAPAKASVWVVLKNPTSPWWQGSATLGGSPTSTFNALARNYKLQGHASSGSQPAANDAGWVDLVTVTDNRWSERVHALSLTGYNWFRFRCTEASGNDTVGGNSVAVQIDIRDVSGGTDDSIFVCGDSISANAFRETRPDNGQWDGGAPLENLVEALTGRAPPVVLNGAVGGWHFSDARANRTDYIGSAQNPCRYVLLNLGSNDANAANIDLGTLSPSGSDSTYAIGVQADAQSLVDYAAGLGRPVIVPTIPWGDLSAWSAANVGYLNVNLQRVLAASVGKAVAGPDLYGLFQAHPTLLEDHLHPRWDPAQGNLFNGVTGYANYLRLWRDALATILYPGG